MTSTTVETAAPEADLRRRGVRLGDAAFKGISILAALAATVLAAQPDSAADRIRTASGSQRLRMLIAPPLQIDDAANRAGPCAGLLLSPSG